MVYEYESFVLYSTVSKYSTYQPVVDRSKKENGLVTSIRVVVLKNYRTRVSQSHSNHLGSQKKKHDHRVRLLLYQTARCFPRACGVTLVRYHDFNDNLKHYKYNYKTSISYIRALTTPMEDSNLFADFTVCDPIHVSMSTQATDCVHA